MGAMKIKLNLTEEIVNNLYSELSNYVEQAFSTEVIKEGYQKPLKITTAHHVEQISRQKHVNKVLPFLTETCDSNGTNIYNRTLNDQRLVKGLIKSVIDKKYGKVDSREKAVDIYCAGFDYDCKNYVGFETPR